MHRFNSLAMKALDTELRSCEEFLSARDSKPVLPMQELRQLVDLVISENIDVYLDANTRKQRFPLLNEILKLIRILEKFKEEGRFSFWRGPQTKHVEMLVATLRKESKP